MSDRLSEEIGSAAAEVGAPARLRARVEAQRQARGHPAPRPWMGAAAVAAGVALVAVTLAGLLEGRSDPRPDVGRAVDVALAGPEGAAPGVDAGDPTAADISIDGLTFPARAYEDSWRPTGSREDTIGGRRALTVVYGHKGERLGYTIVSSPALEIPRGAERVVHAGVRFAVIARGTRAAVAWQRHGHTCVLAGRGVGVGRLLSLVPG